MISLGYRKEEEILTAIVMRGKMLKCSAKEDTLLRETISEYNSLPFSIISIAKLYSCIQIPDEVWCNLPPMRHLPVDSILPQEGSLTFIFESTIRCEVVL